MIGFIGSGNMASAIIKGIVSSGKINEEISIFDIDMEKAKALSSLYGVKVCESSKEIARQCDKVVLSVKPNVFPSLLSEIGEDLKENDPLIISIAAGKTLDYISGLLHYDGRIARVMPNINAKVGAAVSAYCGNERAGGSDLDFVKNLCESFGIGVNIEEKLFSIYSAVGGCGPAYAYMFIDSLARAAVKNGMTKAQALEVAAGTVLGSAKMILQGDEHPWELVDQVCSPGGTTIQGVAALQKGSFESLVGSAVDAAYLMDKSL